MSNSSTTITLSDKIEIVALGISFLSVLFALSSIGIAFWSLRVAQQGNRASVYDRRYEIYGDAERFLSAWMREGNPDLSLLHVLVGAWSRSHFLFDQSVTNYLRQIWLDAVQAGLAAQIMAGQAEGDYQEAVETNNQLLQQHADFDRLRAEFLPHLKV